MPALSAVASSLAGYLREGGLRYEVGPNGYPVPAVVRPLPYLDQWRTLTSEGWYSYRLEDHSLLVFVESDVPSYSYYPCPLHVSPLHVFAREMGFAGADIYSTEMQEKYRLHVDTARLRDHVVPLRFDYDEAGFDDRTHPVAHLHFGHESQIRVGADKIWTPLAFGLFVVRQYYPENWRTLLRRPTAAAIGRKVRTGLRKVGDEYRDPILTREVFLG